MKALIVVDMQEDYVGINRNKKNYLYNTESLINNINMKIEQYRKNDDTIIYIQNVVKGKKPEFVKGLHIASELVYEKHKASCFTSDVLRTFITENSIVDIELVGVDGNYCVGMSALEGAKLGLMVKLICDCVGVSKTEKFERMKKRLIDAGVSLNYTL